MNTEREFDSVQSYINEKFQDNDLEWIQEANHDAGFPYCGYVIKQIRDSWLYLTDIKGDLKEVSRSLKPQQEIVQCVIRKCSYKACEDLGIDHDNVSHLFEGPEDR